MLRHLMSALTLVALPTPDHQPRCRCAQFSLERYFDQAEIVLVGRVRSVRTMRADDRGPERLEVEFTPQFHPDGTFKGSLENRVFATATNTAACGVPVEVGRDYVIFASTPDADQPKLAWFNSCSGSRLYPGASASGEELFLGLATRHVVPRLFALADAGPPATRGEEFHTSPACWREPRIYHQGFSSSAGAFTPRVSRVAMPWPDVEAIASPNRAYLAWTLAPPQRNAGDEAVVLVNVERPTVLRIGVAGAQTSPVLTWVSEKLLFFRVIHGRVQFTDVLVDVELGQVIYTESARYGTDAFAQYQRGCRGQCRCPAAPGLDG